MSLFYSAKTNGFYDPAVHIELFVERDDGEAITWVPSPAGAIDDAIEISDSEHQALLAAQAAGKVITSDADGRPVAIDPPPPPLELLLPSLCNQIDAAADATYVAIGGPSPGRLAEYQQAKADAVAFKGAAYTGDVPATIACWVQSTGWTAQQACDDILATAAAWDGALVAIRTARLLGKKRVTTASNAVDAQSAADAVIASIRAIPAGL